MTTETTKKIPVRELQTFIEAVEFAADTEDWVPSPRQWKRIRQMIDNLELPSDRPALQVQPARQVQPQSYQPDTPVRMVPGGMPSPTYSTPMQPMQQQPLPAPFANPAAPGSLVKTPDIDTSSGGYQSSFA